MEIQEALVEFDKDNKDIGIVLSVVTVCFNDLANLQKTMESVLNQSIFKTKAEEIEYIVVDGNSKDGTRELLAEYCKSERKCFFSYVSEKDSGIYDAMNKGVRMARGKWIHFMNAGDLLYSENTYRNIWKQLQMEKADVLYGSIVKSGRYYEEVVHPERLEYILKRMPFCHQAVFVSRKAQQIYAFDMQFKLAADYDCLLRMYLDKKVFVNIKEIIAVYDMNGVSERNLYKTHAETHKSIQKNSAVKEDLNYRISKWCSGIRLWLIEKMPSSLRWRLVKIKRRMTGKKSI